MDPSWNQQTEMQLIARSHRYGQVAPVCVYRLVSSGFEEYMYYVQLFKLVMTVKVLSSQEQESLGILQYNAFVSPFPKHKIDHALLPSWRKVDSEIYAVNHDNLICTTDFQIEESKEVLNFFNLHAVRQPRLMSAGSKRHYVDPSTYVHNSKLVPPGAPHIVNLNNIMEQKVVVFFHPCPHDFKCGFESSWQLEDEEGNTVTTGVIPSDHDALTQKMFTTYTLALNVAPGHYTLRVQNHSGEQKSAWSLASVCFVLK